MEFWIRIWLALNLFELTICGLDKAFAKKGAWRIPEKVLMGFAIFGASFGLALGMILFHHKVSKPLFRFGVPAMLLLHLVLFLRFGPLWPL